MSHFKQVMFTISKEQDVYIDEILLEDKKTDINIQKRQFPHGRSEYIRKLIDDDMNKPTRPVLSPPDLSKYEDDTIL